MQSAPEGGSIGVRDRYSTVPFPEVRVIGNFVEQTAVFDPKHKYYWAWRFNPGKVDWLGAGLDAAGIVCDAFSFGLAGRATNAVKLAKGAGKALSVADFGRSILDASSKADRGENVDNETWGVIWDFAGLFVPFVPDSVGLYLNFSGAGAFSFSP